MKTFLVTYDLHNRRDYDRIIDAIKKVGDSAELLESVWLVAVSDDLGIVALKERLTDYIDSDDSIAVLPISVGAGFATEKCPKEAVAWLNKYLSTAKK
ncbi:CRISPR-associated endonuclease Cas2 [Pseudomonas syringae]|uniref:CRISPR-associated endonuclease Cas2 n=1 Tax=Pseudomonas syringae TaxID=317 RepID=UPI0018E5B76F|nr:CRISPR-associated endonuclease Cas2 [Pseudomonas syringae]MBI6739720.1 CRISPR-associated endonuclease Cas2 [Pseudomonas syringae]MBI6744136.1 CRISPR-associated endonuclease Cas2 [Pseudomonas syringae]MBI6763156.1 CRISPR-associated endonuclease Cas2 [Pseudomonas syringae]MBI6809576.1 CRISPR-associated endonuclease Cas2 [Pseudomonas syringae]MBI6828639.1 CRISPR-associated endonuclease Cas2 [Pseudomonas syringae]